MATLKPLATEKSNSRPPRPSLFIGPPSHNASSTSLLPQRDRPQSSRAPLVRQTSLLGERPRADTRIDNVLSTNEAGISSPLTRRPAQDKQQATQQQSNERTEAKWVEMQNTLEEIELSATTGAHVFGPGHSKALEELRTAQIALAQAWARSGADADAEELPVEENAEKPQVTADVLSSDKSETAALGRERSGTNESVKSHLEEETENDIAMARKRREANDQYFRRVNAGVKDVVAKLEEVAKAMKGVELESKEIWGDKDSIENGSVT